MKIAQLQLVFEIANRKRSSLAALAHQVCTQPDKSYIRFLMAGCFNTAFTFVIYTTGILLGINYLIANSFAWIVGVLVSFMLSSVFVFKTTYTHTRLLTFALANVLGLLVSLATLSLLIKACSVNPILASLIAIPLVVVMNFLVSKYFVFR